MRTRRWGSTLALAAVTAILGGGQAQAAAPKKNFYVDELTVSKNLEASGIVHRAHIENAWCQGQRWRGYRTVGYEDQFVYFKCSLSATDGHMYTAVVHTYAARKANYYYTQWLSVTRDF